MEKIAVYLAGPRGDPGSAVEFSSFGNRKLGHRIDQGILLIINTDEGGGDEDVMAMFATGGWRYLLADLGKGEYLLAPSE